MSRGRMLIGIPSTVLAPENWHLAVFTFPSFLLPNLCPLTIAHSRDISLFFYLLGFLVLLLPHTGFAFEICTGQQHLPPPVTEAERSTARSEEREFLQLSCSRSSNLLSFLYPRAYRESHVREPYFHRVDETVRSNTLV